MFRLMKMMLKRRHPAGLLLVGAAAVLAGASGGVAWGQTATTSGGAVQAEAEPTKAVENADLPKGAELFAAHLTAVGGAKALQAHQSHVSQMTFSMPSAGMEAEMKISAAAPDKFLLQLTIPALGEVQQGYNGAVAWSMDPMSGANLLDGNQLKQFQIQADFFADINYKKIYKEMTTVGQKEFAGKNCYQVHTVTSFDQKSEVFFDIETGLIQGMESTNETPMGEMRSTTVLKDYQDFGGVKRPVTTEIETFGQKQILTLNSMEFDTVDKSVFELPAMIKALLENDDQEDAAEEKEKDDHAGHDHG